MSNDLENLPEKRKTRGLRISTLDGKDAEFDQEFYGSEFWIDGQGSDEESYEEDAEEAAVDEFDSDFNDTEDEDDEDEDSDDDDGKNKKRSKQRDSIGLKSGFNVSNSGKYKEPKSSIPKVTQPKRKVSFPDDQDRKRSKRSLLSSSSKSSSPVMPPSPRTVRESTKTKSLDTEIADNIRREVAELRQKRLQRQKQREKIKHQYEQKELLKECLDTEIENLKWIENRKALAKSDDALAEKAIKLKQEKESCVRHISKRGQYNMIIFPSTESVPSILKLTDDDIPEPVESAVCVVTGLPAKYRDPKTLFPYANTYAFQILKQQYPR